MSWTSVAPAAITEASTWWVLGKWVRNWMVHILWPLRGLPLEGTSSSIRLEVLEVFPQAETWGQGCLWRYQTSSLDFCISPGQQDRRWLLLLLPQLLCTEYLIGFLITFSASMLTYNVFRLPHQVGLRNSFIQVFLAYCTRPCALAQPAFAIVCLPLVLIFPGTTKAQETFVELWSHDFSTRGH